MDQDGYVGAHLFGTTYRFIPKKLGSNSAHRPIDAACYERIQSAEATRHMDTPLCFLYMRLPYLHLPAILDL